MYEQKMITSPLRYPGGKSKAIKFLKKFIPSFSELREPFFGGGSFTFYCVERFPRKRYLASDINYELYCFWNELKCQTQQVISGVQQIYDKHIDGRELFKLLLTRRNEDLSRIERAIDFFVLNRITFSGTVDSGGYSQGSFDNRFTQTSIDRLKSAAKIIQHIDFDNEDYSIALNLPGENVFIFLDPPYKSVRKSRLYGKNGILHFEFDHQLLRDTLQACAHKWLMTYDDCQDIRDLYKDYYIVPWKLQYGMNNYKKDSAGIGSELLISNFDLSEVLHENTESFL